MSEPGLARTGCCLIGALIVVLIARPVQSAPLALSAASVVWRPADELSPSLTLLLTNATNQDVPEDRLTSWQVGLKLVPRANASGTLGFGIPSLPSGYLLAGHSLGLFQAASPADQLRVADAAVGGNAGAVPVPSNSTPLVAVALTAINALGVFDLVALRADTLWTGRESLDPAERAFSNFPGDASQVTLATITVLPALVGDANGDCSVGAADYALWAAQFGQTGVGLTADFDGSGTVGAGDYALWAANFGKTCMPAGASVPEPGTWALAILGTALPAAWFLAVTRRRNLAFGARQI